MPTSLGMSPAEIIDGFTAYKAVRLTAPYPATELRRVQEEYLAKVLSDDRRKVLDWALAALVILVQNVEDTGCARSRVLVEGFKQVFPKDFSENSLTANRD